MKVISPSSNNLRASCSLSAHPSKRIAPTQEPCIGSVIFSYLIGGPACNNTFSLSSGILDLAGTTSTKNGAAAIILSRSEEHTSELQSRFDLVCRLLLEKK